MFEVKLQGLEQLQKKIETLEEHIRELHKQVPHEMVEWQTQDMRRKYPNIQVDETPQSVEAKTEVWPRSRLEQDTGFKRPYRPPSPTKGPRTYHPKGVGRPPPSTRPILRSELLRKLYDRMIGAAKEAVKWP